MKTYRQIRTAIIVAATLLLSLPHITGAASYVVGLSPHYSPPDSQKVLQELLLFILEGAGAGDEVLVYDALNNQPVADFQIPKDGLLQANARARATKLASPVVKLRKFLNEERTADPNLTGVVHLPEFLDLVGPQLRSPGEPITVLILASPHYVNPKMPSFNMDDAYPSDAHLRVDQSISVFGTALRGRTLSGVTVHYAFTQDGSFINDYHRERIARFWSLFVAQQGGVLATFAPDIRLAFRRAQEGHSQPVVSAKLDISDTKVQMLPVRRRAVPRWMSQTSLPQDLPIQTTHGKIGIGIMWSAKVDCDLWVKAHGSASDLCFANRTTPEGRYFHDYRSANQGVDYEYVEIDQSTDLRNVKAWVNYYAGKSRSVDGVVVVRLNGQSYRGKFRLKASRGNGAHDRDRRERSSYWTELDLLEMVGIPGSTASTSRR